jgi:quercetin dioxygenase-like cupin family protein
MRPIQALLVAALLPIHFAHAQSTKEQWSNAPAIFPAGAKMAVVQGDPSREEMFTVRLKFPKGYRVAPHFHPTDEHLTIINGTFLIGMGDAIEPKKAMALSPGDTVTAPANGHHYAIAKTQTVVEIRAMGPFKLTYVNAADDPTRKSGAER